MQKVILKGCLLVGLSFGLANSAQAYSGEVYTVCKLNPEGDNFLALRSCPSSSCKKVEELDPGTFLWTEEPYSEGSWRAVIVMRNIQDEYPINRPRGFVYDEFICRIVY